MAGRTNSSKVTADETGLPGRPNSRTGAPPPGRSAIPNANGLPGWTATRHRSIRPIVSMAVLTTSYGPTETPPDTMSASAPSSRPRRRRVRTSSRSSVAMPRSIGSPPAAVTSARRPGPLASGIPAGPSGWPGARTSSPVARTAIRGRRWTRMSLDAGAGDERHGRRGDRRAGPRGASRRPSRSLPAARTEPPGSTALVDEAGGRERARSRRGRADPGGRRRRAASSPRPGRRHRRRRGAARRSRSGRPCRARP